MAENTPVVAPNLGALANSNYARGAAYEHGATVRRIMEAGARSLATIAGALNRLGVPSSNRREWGARSAGRLLKRLGVDRNAWATRDMEAFREAIEYLWWEHSVRTRPEIVIGLNRLAVRTTDGCPWTTDRVGKLIRLFGLDWSDGAPILRRGDSVLEAIEVPGVVELVAAIEAPAIPQEVEAPKPIVVREAPPPPPRRRAIRA
ncbi:hypothetical protein ACLBXB_14340 [Methylobacterium mesophilicum]